VTDQVPLTALSREEIDAFVSHNFPSGFGEPEVPSTAAVEVAATPEMPERRIALALLSYDAKLYARTAMALMASVVKLGAVGMPVSCILREGDSMVARGRSFLASQFLTAEGAKQCTDLVFVDLDLNWNGDELVRLCSHPVDIVGAAYPYKDDSGNFPLRWPRDGLNEYDYGTGGLWRVQAVTPGFFRVTRKALETIAADQPFLEFKDQGNAEGQRSWMFFDNLQRPTGIYDEGYVFCERARQAGLTIHLDPDLEFGHIGMKEFRHGTIRQWLDKKAKEFDVLESEYPGVPPLRLVDKIMGQKVDLDAAAQESAA
jgi:hypothetical protein